MSFFKSLFSWKQLKTNIQSLYHELALLDKKNIVLREENKRLKEENIHLANMLKTTKLEEDMDKQIKKVKKDLDKGQKDTKSLLKMDKEHDKKMKKCEKVMKKKK